MSTITRKQFDTDTISWTLRAAGGSDLTNATSGTLTLFARNASTDALKINGASATVVSATATVVEAEYDPVAGDVDTAGTFVVEWHLVMPDGKKLVWPSTGQDTIIIEDSVST